MDETSPQQAIDRQYEAFIGPKAAFYLSKFKKFSINGIDNFQATWNWPAFLFTFWWMLYRKMYLWALGTFIVLSIPYAGLAAWIGCGIGGNYLYYRFVRGKVEEAKQANPSDFLSALRQLGGTHEWVKIVGVLATLLGLFAMIMIGGLAALLGS